MHSTMRSLLVLALLAVATVALAANEEPKTHVQDFSEGHERIESGPVPRPRLNSEELALQEINDAGRQAVAILVAQLQGMTSEQARVDIQKQIEAAKTQSRIALLHKIIEFAAAKGDEAKVLEARRILDITLNGPQDQPQNIQRPAPARTQGGN